jgi:hypothetical protein
VMVDQPASIRFGVDSPSQRSSIHLYDGLLLPSRTYSLFLL